MPRSDASGHESTIDTTVLLVTRGPNSWLMLRAQQASLSRTERR